MRLRGYEGQAERRALCMGGAETIADENPARSGLLKNDEMVYYVMVWRRLINF